MKIIAIELARIAVLLELQSLDPHGKTNIAEVVAALAEKYSFRDFPTSFREIDPDKGIELKLGVCDGIHVDRIALFVGGIVIDTRSSTDNSEKVLMDLLNLARQLFGAEVVPARRHYVSHVVFQSNLSLANAVHPLFAKITERITPRVSSDMNEQISYETTAVLLGSDNTQRKLSPSQFSLERRKDTLFAQNTYFSAAPLHTSEHLQI